MKLKLPLLILLLGLAFGSHGQAQTVTGTVTDQFSGESLPGVAVRVKGTTRGAVTNLDGVYNVQAAGNDTLQFSFVGYLTEEVPVANRTTISLALAPDIETLGEVVVVGYGTTTKKELTGAVSVVDAEAIKGLNPVRLEQALQGQVAGVQISSASGSPGGALNIRIRGLSTNGNNNPLVLVDGIPYSTEGLNALNPADIESVNVLKDATAGIYGVQAANGVIIITTKKGKLNSKPTFGFDGYYGVQSTARKLDLLNAREFAILKNETFGAAGQTLPYPNVELGEGTDWQNEVFQSAPIQNYNFNVNGGAEKSTYSIGASYLDQEGIIGGDKSGFRRYNARINYITELAPRVNLENILLYTNEQRKTLAENGIGSVLYNTINASPLDAVYSENGRYTYLENFSDIINPLAQIANTFNDNRTNKIVGKQELSYEFNDNFTATGRAGYNYAVVDYKGFSPLVYYGQSKAQNTASDENLTPFETELNGVLTPVPNNVTEARTTYFNYNLEAFLNYERVFEEVHKVKATLGTSLFEDRGNNITGTAFDIPYNSWEFADISMANGTNLRNNTSSYQFRSRLQSYFVRAEYGFKEKYLFSAILRRDASSRFGKNNRYGYFPTASAAWVISDESFFNINTIEFLKFRGSYGISGNDKIGDFRYRALLGGEAVYAFDDNLVNGNAFGVLGNEDLRWEQTSQANIGLDFSFMKGRLDVSTDYYVKNTKDLLSQPDVSGVLGAYGAGSAPPWINAGDVSNKGFEFLVSYNDQLSDNFGFNVSYNLTTIKNEVTGLANGVEFLNYGDFGVGGGSATRMEVGYPIGYFFGYQTNGVYQTAEEIAAGGLTQEGARPGDFRYVDQNGDGIISFGNNNDKTFLGSAIPDVTMGLNLGLNFRGIDLAANIFGSFGNEILRNYERQQPLANVQTYRLGRWTGANSTDDQPRLTTAANNNAVLSDFFVEDGSFIRLKNLQLGYSLPNALINQIGLERFRIYVSANNLLTFTGYRGFDPDFSSGDPNTSGIDYGAYPQARIIMTGVNINF